MNGLILLLGWSVGAWLGVSVAAFIVLFICVLIIGIR